MSISRQAVQKHPSAALRSSFVIAAYKKYASFFTISRVLHPDIFEQPEKLAFFKESLGIMAKHSHTFVEKHTGMLCFGASRRQDEATLICCLQKFSDDQVMEALVPRLNDVDRELIFNMLIGILKKHFSEEEYHSLFLKDT